MSNVVNLALALAVVISCAFHPAGAQAQIVEPSSTPLLVINEPNHVYAPPGFDDNDNVQLVLTAVIPATCYRAGPVEVEVDHSARSVVLKHQIYYYPDQTCHRVVTPVFHVVDLGLMPEGEYNVSVVRENGARLGKNRLNVARSSNTNPDEALYAYVQNVDAIRLPDGRPGLVVRGTLTDSCMNLNEVRVLYRSADVIEVLPFARYDQNQSCLEVIEPFEIVVPLDPRLRGERLVHVRSLNGQSLNRLFVF